MRVLSLKSIFLHLSAMTYALLGSSVAVFRHVQISQTVLRPMNLFLILLFSASLFSFTALACDEIHFKPIERAPINHGVGVLISYKVGTKTKTQMILAKHIVGHEAALKSGLQQIDDVLDKQKVKGEITDIIVLWAGEFVAREGKITRLNEVSGFLNKARSEGFVTVEAGRYRVRVMPRSIQQFEIMKRFVSMNRNLFNNATYTAYREKDGEVEHFDGAMSKAKRDFLFEIRHEIRTHMSHVQSFSEYLIKLEWPLETQKGYLRDIFTGLKNFSEMAVPENYQPSNLPKDPTHLIHLLELPSEKELILEIKAWSDHIQQMGVEVAVDKILADQMTEPRAGLINYKSFLQEMNGVGIETIQVLDSYRGDETSVFVLGSI